MTRPIALTVAGSDSGGGAGIQADLKTFHQFGVFGTSVVTAVTAQNTLGVSAVGPVPATLVAQQLDAVAEDLKPAAVKTGMLATAHLIVTVQERLQRWGLFPLVVDPVMVSTSGDRLLDASAVDALRRLIRVAALVTPNVPEAVILTGIEIEGPDDSRRAAHALVEMGAGAALVKGGHLPGSATVVDVLWDGTSNRTFSHPRLETVHTHGTGCTLSAAVTAGLAHDRPLTEAVSEARLG